MFTPNVCDSKRSQLHPTEHQVYVQILSSSTRQRPPDDLTARRSAIKAHAVSQQRTQASINLTALTRTQHDQGVDLPAWPACRRRGSASFLGWRLRALLRRLLSPPPRQYCPHAPCQQQQEGGPHCTRHHHPPTQTDLRLEVCPTAARRREVRGDWGLRVCTTPS